MKVRLTSQYRRVLDQVWSKLTITSLTLLNYMDQHGGNSHMKLVSQSVTIRTAGKPRLCKLLDYVCNIRVSREVHVRNSG